MRDLSLVFDEGSPRVIANLAFQLHPVRAVGHPFGFMCCKLTGAHLDLNWNEFPGQGVVEDAVRRAGEPRVGTVGEQAHF